jgi:hypothetical protein
MGRHLLVVNRDEADGRAGQRVEDCHKRVSAQTENVFDIVRLKYVHQQARAVRTAGLLISIAHQRLAFTIALMFVFTFCIHISRMSTGTGEHDWKEPDIRTTADQTCLRSNDIPLSLKASLNRMSQPEPESRVRGQALLSGARR